MARLLRRIIKRPRTYFDSVTLMRISTEAQKLHGVTHVAVVMATEMNKANLNEAGFDLGEISDMGPNDLVIAVAAESDEAIDQTVVRVDELVGGIGKDNGGESQAKVHTLDGALSRLEGANLAIISTPGAFATREVMRALDRGLNVMLFSDNVPIEKEVAMKQVARERGLLVMGPDCGTVILHGKPMGFANVVRRGSIGLVAASGTGLQEVTCLVHQMGGGVSHAIGTGGRDLSEEVGGITMLQGIDLLEQDPSTSVIVLISKPPAASVMERLLERVGRLTKPCVAYFLGATPEQQAKVVQVGADPAQTMEETAMRAVIAARRADKALVPDSAGSFQDMEAEVEAALKLELVPFQGKRGNGRYLRGLYSGGTLCQESLLALQEMLGTVYSNIAKKPAYQLADPNVSQEHTLVDMGEDFFTQNRPHPMIDVRYRLARIAEEAARPEVAVILLDTVIGYGANADPAGELARQVQEIRKELAALGRHVAFIGSVTGTDEDPQVRSQQMAKLREAGVTVMSTNYRAALLAGRLIKALQEVQA